MRVSVIPEQRHGPCSNCNLPGQVTTFTICAGSGVESTQPLCAACLRDKQEVAVDIPQPPPPEAGPPSRAVKKASRRNERFIAESIGGKMQPASGSLPGAKGDVRKRGEFRIEAKDSYSNQFILKLPVLHKIMAECDRAEKPAVVVTFMEKNTYRPRERWVVIPYSDWEDIVNGSGHDS